MSLISIFIDYIATCAWLDIESNYTIAVIFNCEIEMVVNLVLKWISSIYLYLFIYFKFIIDLNYFNCFKNINQFINILPSIGILLILNFYSLLFQINMYYLKNALFYTFNNENGITFSPTGIDLNYFESKIATAGKLSIILLKL